MALRALGMKVKSDVKRIVERRRRDMTSDPVDDEPGDGGDRAALRAFVAPHRVDTATPLTEVKANPNIPTGMPAEGKTSSAFGMRLHPIHRKWLAHNGEDIAAPRGTPVHATAAGTVTRAAAAGGFGNLVEIEHDATYRTRYAHLDTITVKAGQEVLRGDLIGTVGSTGTATGPHLHYEVLVKGKQVNPTEYLT